ncbi:hypothetical protein [Streptosporangium vulgare]|uniref:hypothetical protein n=1 Tax=Streptosporangium vulgare TaxID=46190 RepID=UPI0031E3224E
MDDGAFVKALSIPGGLALRDTTLWPHPTPRLWLTTFSFDISPWSCSCPRRRARGSPSRRRRPHARARRSPGALRHESHRQGITRPLRLVIDQVSGLLAGRRVLCGGEPMPAVLARPAHR